LNNPGIQIGLTATPCTVGAEFDDDEDRLFVRDTLRFFEVDKPTFSYKLKDAIRDGFLVPYHIYKALTVKTAAEGGFEVKRSELDWSAMDAETRAEFDRLFNGGDTITVDPSALERRFTIPERNRAIVREFRQVLDHGFTDSKGVLRKPLIGKTIVFAVNKRHAETLAKMFDDAFADRKDSADVRYADFVVSGMGNEDTPDGMSMIKRFKKEPFPKSRNKKPPNWGRVSRLGCSSKTISRQTRKAGCAWSATNFAPMRTLGKNSAPNISPSIPSP